MRWLIAVFTFCATLCYSQNTAGEARALVASGQYGKARALLAQELKTAPDDPALLEAMGDVLAREKQWESASAWYAKLAQIRPEYADAHYKYGIILSMRASESKWFAIRNAAEIKKAFETCLALNPKHIGGHWAMIEYYLRVPDFLGGSTKKAKDYAERLSEISGINGLLARARLALFEQNDVLAETLYLTALRDYNSPSAREKLIELYTRTKQMQKARALGGSQPTNKSS